MMSSILVTLAVLMASPGPTEGSTSPDSVTAEASTDLVVAVEPEMLQGEAHRLWVEERGRAVLDRLPPLAPGDRISITIGGATSDYTIEVRVIRQGEALPTQPEPLECKGSTDKLLDEVEAAVIDGTRRLDEAAREEQEAEAARLRAEEERRQQQQRERERERIAQQRAEREAIREQREHQPYRPSRLGSWGAVGTGVGGSMLVSGIVLAAVGDRRSSGNDLLVPADLTAPGGALLGIGVPLLTAGVAMLVIDVVRCKQDRAACADHTPLHRAGLRRGLAWRRGASR